MSSLADVAHNSGVLTPSLQRGLSRVDTHSVMDTVYEHADQSYMLSLESEKKEYVIGKDFLRLRIKAAKEGYLTLLTVGTTGTIYQLFPNNLDSSNYISAGRVLELPRAEWRIRSQGPAGKNRFIALVTTYPKPFEGLWVKAGPFLKLDSNHSIVDKFFAKLTGRDGPCEAVISEERDFSVEGVTQCDFAYGAAWLDIYERNP